ncbi:MAG: alpha/beta fold hydrolase [Candidatus Dormibacteraeota bacterium]|nr:alpha/beta fold hydrolase [Candidatus Dormibacteraeota bacterium]
MAQRAETRDTAQQAAEPSTPGRPRGRRGTTRPGPKRTRRPASEEGRGGDRKTASSSSRADRAESRTEPAGRADRRAPEPVAEEAGGAILGANPFVGIDPTGALSSAGRWLAALGRHPLPTASRAAASSLELGRIALGRSEVAPQKGDRRFADPAWSEHPGFRRTMQSYLMLSSTLQSLVEDADLDWKSEQQTRYMLQVLTDTLAPTNSLLGNPAAIKRAFDTAGLSLLRGVRNLVDDVRHNGAMPSMVDKRPFEVGRNIAVTPGAVVYRDEVLELIQYAPTTETVHRRPVVLVPPQINKYYILDLAPQRSFIEYAVSQGVPLFAISWRNPTAAQRNWDLDTYAQACLAAVDAANEITGSDDCNLFGACAGGITMALLLGHLAAKRSRLVNSATFAVTIMDTETPSMVGMFASPASIDSAIKRSRKKGYLDGAEMSRIFAWLRPNDLIWNYWVNNYLMGNDPPAFDILYWNADNTRLPAGLHAGFLELFRGNPLREPGAITVLGTPVDLKTVRIPAYVLGGITDHIVPWASAYGATQVLGGPTQFVLNSSGHIQSLVNPPGNPKASYRVDGPRTPDPQKWLSGATEVRGTWWEHWARWIGEQSGGSVPAAGRLGSDRHAPQGSAPGTYVHQT